MTIDRMRLEIAAKHCIGYLLHVFGKKIGITVFVFEFGEGGNLAYISNSDRAGMIAAVKEWLARAEAGLDTDPPGPRAQG
jgi:hypothetical protein